MPKIKLREENQIMIYGYGRVSTKGQAKDGNSLEAQEMLLKEHGAEVIYMDSFTGTKMLFINRFGNVQHQGTVNKAIRRIIRDCNDYQLTKGGRNSVLLPKFFCHSLRHTFTTRLVEAGVNIKVVQNVLGHADFSTTMDIYTDVTKELKQREFGDLESKLKEQKKGDNKNELL